MLLLFIYSVYCVNVLLVPGTGGNRLTVRLNNTQVPHHGCPKSTTGVSPLWLPPLISFFPPKLDCWTATMRLKYSPEKSEFVALDGVTVDVPYFGKVESVATLSDGLIKGDYFAPLIAFLNRKGLKSNIDITAAPYDFRYPVSVDWVQRTKALIEQQASSPTIIIAHSMGCLFTLKFLSQMSVQWLDKYIKHFVAIGCPFAGVADELKIYASGDNRGLKMISAQKLRLQQRTSASNLWLLPNPDYFKSDDVWLEIVGTDGTRKKYTPSRIRELLTEIGFPEGAQMIQGIREILREPLLRGPPVPSTCIFSSGRATNRQFTYKRVPSKDWTLSEPVQTFSTISGDGIVDKESINVCNNWSYFNANIKVHVINKNIDHANLINAPEVLSIIERIL